ncbi:helicase C-terminal domain-containing protein [Mycena metata]|uniref:ATP-dependent DNA helicase CHL1 n=1 Tax=Mycena metata TaxID=1033252 RepID=A0AAD7H897_9AGAR|nr:helicase C-terminal domain-containing protein [Mycena metata]
MSDAISLSLPTPTEFPAFPFPPYAIQVDLMRHLYTSIEGKKVTIVESPTGTGKTLSLLCASLTWLTDEKNRAKKGILDALGTETDAGRDWVLAQTRERRARELEAEEREYEERLREARKKEEAMKRMARSRVHKKAKLDTSPGLDFQDPDDIFLPESPEDEEDNISPAVRALMARVEKGVSKNSFFDQEDEPTCTKIYYASRTHSQLAQILPELRRLKLIPVVPAVPSTFCDSSAGISRKRAAPDEEDDMPVVYSRTVSLGSRKQLCINDMVRSKSKDLDEGCRELIAEKGDKRCQYLPPIGENTQMLDFRDQILASPKDIEDLATVGRLAHTCPYFGSRRAIPQAELITLPYNLLLQKTAREALGIDLTDQIVIIDEAHNLIPTLLSLSTARLPFSTLSTSFQQVCIYVAKFRAKLSPTNMLHLKRLVMFLDGLQKYALEWKEKNAKADCKAEVMTVADLLDRLGRKVAGINLLEIEAYLKSSKIARKVSGYSDKEAEKQDPKLRPRRGAVPPLHAVEAFLLALTGTNDDGRLTLSLVRTHSGQEDVEMKYQLLNPAPHFLEVVEAARSVILAGGTMSPISDVINQLFTQLPSEKITSFSCGHIIPESNLRTIVVSKGPRGAEVEYKAGKQGDEAVIGELGQILLNFASLVPHGMIVFFPSYHFLNTAKAAWQKSGALGRFEGKKKVFFEPEQATQVDQVLQDYSAAVHGDSNTESSVSFNIASLLRAAFLQVKRGGGLLFAVIGAKLSEGLNFADDLARAVVIVGLPFANLGSPELRERMKYVKQLEEKRGIKRPPGQKDAAAELYENLCMNAVNQSIGRAIRHRGDWAALILLDQRYGSASIRAKLPKWIGGGMTVADGFGQVIRDLGSFYRDKRL